jgi:MFS family permease
LSRNPPTATSFKSCHCQTCLPNSWSPRDSGESGIQKSSASHDEHTLPIDGLFVDHTIVPRLLRKYDLRILILFVIINIFNFIDRVNIGNARLLGMVEDVGLVGIRYNIALMCGFIFASAVEIPSNILCKKIGAGKYIPFLVFSFGLTTTLTSLGQSPGGLYVARLVLGFFEGGVSPGCVYLLSQL